MQLKAINHAGFGALPEVTPYATNGRMDKTIRKYTDFDEMKADEYRYWQSRPVHERVAAVSELTQEHYAMKGEVPGCTQTSKNSCPF